MSAPSSSQKALNAVQVLEMLSHVNKRVRDHREIGLPLPQLVALFQASLVKTTDRGLHCIVWSPTPLMGVRL